MNSTLIFRVILAVLMLATVGLVGAAVASGGTAEMISLNLLWAYFLAALGIFAALLCAVMGMVSAPSSIKMTALSVALVAIVIGISSYVASTHSYQIVNLGDGGFFAADETKITEASVLVTYAAGAAAVIVALLSEVMGLIGGGVAKRAATTEE